GGLRHLPGDGPQERGQRLVGTLGGELGVSAADQSHFQVVEGEVWPFQGLQQALGQVRFSRMGTARDQNDHFHTLRQQRSRLMPAVTRYTSSKVVILTICSL